MSWFHDLIIRLGGGQPEPKLAPAPQPAKVPPGYSAAKAKEDQLRANQRLADAVAELQKVKEQINANRPGRAYNPYRNVTPYQGWSVIQKPRVQYPIGAIPLVFDINGNRIPYEDVSGWGIEPNDERTRLRTLSYHHPNDGTTAFTKVAESEYIRWKNHQKGQTP